MKWINDFLTGADNQSLAVGRVLGAMLFVNLLLAFPAVIGGVLLYQHVTPDVWFSYMDKLIAFVPSMGGTATLLIAGTAFTEPKPVKDAPQ